MEKTIPIVLIFCMIISLTPIPKSVSLSSETIHFYYDFEKREGPTSGWVDFDGDGDYDYRIDICNWNINGAEGGRMDMMYNKSMNMLVIETSLWGARPQTYVNGYPEIYVGRKPWDRQYANGLGLNFPYKVSDLIAGTASITVSFYVNLQSLDPNMNLNIAADAWLVDERRAFNPGSGLSIPYVEIMVWVFSHNLGPAGSMVGRENMCGRAWEVWRSIGRDNSTYIAIVPHGWNLSDGSISYDVAEVMRIVEKYAPFNISNYYLVGWELGMEWGTKNSNGVAQFQCTISNYTLVATPAIISMPSFNESTPYITVVIVPVIAALIILIFNLKRKRE